MKDIATVIKENYYINTKKLERDYNYTLENLSLIHI